jgi:hypothetical protein
MKSKKATSGTKEKAHQLEEAFVPYLSFCGWSYFLLGSLRALRILRSFMRALCNCDFEVPTATPSIFAISSCS